MYDVDPTVLILLRICWASLCTGCCYLERFLLLFLKFFFCPFFPLRLPITCTFVFNGIPQLSEALFIFLYFFFSAYWIISIGQYSRSLIFFLPSQISYWEPLLIFFILVIIISTPEIFLVLFYKISLYYILFYKSLSSHFPLIL